MVAPTYTECDAIAIAVTLLRAPLDDALEALLDAGRAGVAWPVMNRSGWLLLRWHHLAEGGARA